MTQPCAFVDPSSLSLPSPSLKRPASPTSTDDSSHPPADEPPRKRPRSGVTPEERKEARAHRNRIAAQNSRDRRKAQFGYLERRVAELEEENRRLRAGIHVSPSPSMSTLSESTIEREQEHQRKRQEEQRERENQELRERIRTLEKGYEAVVRALAAQGNPSITSSIPTPPTTTPTPIIPSHSQPPSSPPNPESCQMPSPPSPNATTLSSSMPLSPSSPSSTLVDSPLLFSSGDPFEFAQSPALPAMDPCLALPENHKYPHLPPSTGGEHCWPFGSVPAAGVRYADGNGTGEHSEVSGSHETELEDEAASDAAITRLFAEILTSPSLGSSALPSAGTSSEDAVSEEVLTKTETRVSGLGLDMGMSSMDAVDWAEQVRAEMEMEKLLEMLPNAQDVTLDAILRSNVNLDADMDLSSAFPWNGVSVS